MPTKTEIVAIVAGTLIVAGGVALELAGKAVAPEVWIAGSAAIAGGLGLAAPSSATTSAGANALSELAGELSKLAGYLTVKAAATTPASEPAAAADGIPVGPVTSATESPSAPGAPPPATSSPNSGAVVMTPAGRAAASIGGSAL